jgi:hypothetical protein
MKRLLALFSVVLLVALAGCGSDSASKKIDENSTKAAAKTGDQQTKSDAKSSNTKNTSTTSEPAKQDDVWTYYNNATWSNNFNGLKLQVEKVVVTDKAPELSDTTKRDASAVGVRFKLENTTKGKFTVYPDQAVLVTSTGEQIDTPEMLATDHIGGEIDLGVIKEGNVIWYLQRGHAADIKWVKLKFSGHVGGEDQLDGQSKDFEFTINLK